MIQCYDAKLKKLIDVELPSNDLTDITSNEIEKTLEERVVTIEDTLDAIFGGV